MSPLRVLLVIAIAAVAVRASTGADPGDENCACTSDATARAECEDDIWRNAGNNRGVAQLTSAQLASDNLEYTCLGEASGVVGSCGVTITGYDLVPSAGINYKTDVSCPVASAVDSNIFVTNSGQPDRYFAEAIPQGVCGGGHLFVCDVNNGQPCWEGCSGMLSTRWVEAGMVTFDTTRDMNGEPVSAHMEGRLKNTGDDTYELMLICDFSDFSDVFNGGLTFKDECDTLAHTQFWDAFNVAMCTAQPIFPGGDASANSEIVTFTNSRTKGEGRGLQIGTHRAFLKDDPAIANTDEDKQVGASLWIGADSAAPRGAAGSCRWTSQNEVGHGYNNIVDLNFRLIPTCELTCDPYSQITGDPHVVGFLGQRFNVLGDDGEVYNMITSPHLQYNARFNSTEFTVRGKPATLVAEMGLRVGAHKVRIAFVSAKSQEIVVEVDGVRVPAGSADRIPLSADGSEWIMRTQQARNVIIITKDYHFNVLGQLHRFHHLDDGVKLVNWVSATSNHGLLGQTADFARAQKANKEFVIDFDWPRYLDGSLADYTVAGGDIFGTDFTYSLFDESN